MENSKEIYISPFSTRYSSKEMQYIFSEKFKFLTWRKLWLILAKAQKELGLNITEEQIKEMEENLTNINYDIAIAREKEVRHDVMSHIYAYAKQCPKAEPIIHLGATSCYVGDNTDIIILKKASELILKKSIQVVKNLTKFANKYKNLPCLSYTHLQPAQISTIGKRATIWIYELIQDIELLQERLNSILLLGSKGTTGTQASFMELFENDEQKVKELENIIAKELGFKGCVPVSGQTYSRKVDYYFLSILSGFAQSAYKFSNDIRILQAFEEIEEPFEEKQIGSSAMPYKRNPMRCERISALARYVIVNSTNPALTASTQWLERTLDDSANRRISVSESFLAIDAILNIYINVTSNLVVYKKIINKRVMEKLPFMATENIMMRAVKKGGNRQELHEKLREHSYKASKKVKLDGLENDLIERIANDSSFNLSLEEIKEVLNPNLYIGRSVSQVEDFINQFVDPLVKNFKDEDLSIELNF